MAVHGCSHITQGSLAFMGNFSNALLTCICFWGERVTLTRCSSSTPTEAKEGGMTLRQLCLAGPGGRITWGFWVGIFSGRSIWLGLNFLRRWSTAGALCTNCGWIISWVGLRIACCKSWSWWTSTRIWSITLSTPKSSMAESGRGQQPRGLQIDREGAPLSSSNGACCFLLLFLLLLFQLLPLAPPPLPPSRAPPLLTYVHLFFLMIATVIHLWGRLCFPRGGSSEKLLFHCVSCVASSSSSSSSSSCSSSCPLLLLLLHLLQLLLFLHTCIVSFWWLPQLLICEGDCVSPEGGPLILLYCIVFVVLHPPHPLPPPLVPALVPCSSSSSSFSSSSSSYTFALFLFDDCHSY